MRLLTGSEPSAACGRYSEAENGQGQRALQALAYDVRSTSKQWLAGLVFRLDPTDEEVVHSPRCLSGFGADLQVDRLPFHVLCFVRGNKRDEFTDHIGS